MLRNGTKSKSPDDALLEATKRPSFEYDSVKQELNGQMNDAEEQDNYRE